MIEHLVSTVIPVRNRPKMVVEAVESVLAQTYRPIEILISDDGSTDETPEVCQALCRDNPGIVRLMRGEPRGAGPAREAGRQQARGEFIQYLDSDDLLLPRKFEIQVRALREHPECDAAYGFIRFRTAEGSPLAKPFKRSGEALPALFPWLLVERWWNTDCPLFRRSVCDAVGAWSDLRYSQDWEYDARVGALGTKLAHCAEFVCEQRRHAGAMQTGHGRWLDPPSQAFFFRRLFECACQAGVGSDSSEMRHFVRWVFYAARECGLQGDGAAARECIETACKAAGSRLPGDLQLFVLTSRILGSVWASRFFAGLARCRSGGAGPRTLAQSWMSQLAE